MTAHHVSPLRGFPLENRHYPWGSRPRLFDAVPPGLKTRNFKTCDSGTIERFVAFRNVWVISLNGLHVRPYTNAVLRLRTDVRP